MTAEEFAGKIKAYRQIHGITQEEASGYFGLSVRTWQNWEIARNMPRGYGLTSLLAALEKSGPEKHSKAEKRSKRSKPPTVRQVGPDREEEGLATHLL